MLYYGSLNMTLWIGGPLGPINGGLFACVYYFRCQVL